MNLDLALPVGSIILTILLTAVGVEMANNPPTSKGAKWAYRTAFIVLGLLLIGTTYWQGKRNFDEQNRIKAEGQAQEKRLEERYEALKEQNDKMDGELNAIASFAKHPPSGLNPRQVNEAIRAMAGPGNLKERAIKLSDEIMEDPYLHGYKQRGFRGVMLEHVPTDPVKMSEWMVARSSYFRFRFRDRVNEMRDEFATLHLYDERLDQELKMEREIPSTVPTYPQTIEQISDSLKELAAQVKN
jgi:hypothetical protein